MHKLQLNPFGLDIIPQKTLLLRSQRFVLQQSPNWRRDLFVKIFRQMCFHSPWRQKW